MKEVQDLFTGARRFSLLHADCRDIHPLLPRKGIAVLTDPPYGINYDPSGGVGRSGARRDYKPVEGDTDSFDPAPFLSFSTAILFGGNHYADQLPPSSSWFVWDKRDGCGSNQFADCELAWSNAGGPARLFHHRWMGMMRDSEKNTPRIHPTQKPVALFRWIIGELNLPKGTVIYDPYAGSGAVGVAALLEGHPYLGVEIDGHYIPLIQERLEKACEGGVQLKMEALV